jgi:tRNA(adenine34) deaminase
MLHRVANVKRNPIELGNAPAYTAAMLDYDDTYWMQLALQEAQQAAEAEEVPVGAVIVRANKLIARGRNRIEQLQDATAHAEIEAITAASDFVANRRLLDTTLYVTLEPCPMCAGAIIQARIPRLVFATRDSKAGACVSLYHLLTDSRLNHQVSISEGVLKEQAASLLSSFFRRLRQQTAN